MAIPEFLADLRAHVGNALVVLPSVCAAVFDDDGRLLFASHHQGIWAPPGGIIEPDEHPRDAAVREIREETGLEIEVRDLIGAYGGPEFRVVYPNGDKVSYVITVYGCWVIGGTLVPDQEEIGDARFLAENELDGLRRPAWTGIAVPDMYAWWRASRR
ncbi:NUDIX domain-containing protein [Spongiactinospora sp. TRM90649]|uniref:NUDIX domain-containing protein n=1 Tax=Spongiactinospora sp. TRM90649 TaxID=3031114 RepID=UPI0023F8078F|nr:NUDIX domain-containing protein [Spongiactinospora sp. TRM90649]MDF5751435.1 NUDIX domain-containing protein [Spongiactinospora sp. TRM90649]